MMSSTWTLGLSMSGSWSIERLRWEDTNCSSRLLSELEPEDCRAAVSADEDPAAAAADLGLRTAPVVASLEVEGTGSAFLER